MNSIVIAALGLFFSVLVLLLALDRAPIGNATMGTLVNVSNSTPTVCTTYVQTGMNVISFACISTAQARTEVMNDTDVLSMYQYVPGELDRWRVHNPTLPSWVVSDLQVFSRKAGYIVFMNASHAYTINGFTVASTSIPLAAGWNLVGYPSINEKNASQSFAGLNMTVARAYNASTPAYVSYPAGGLVTTIPGQGYWINATQSTTWSVS